MPIHVQGPDGAIVEFPDGTTPEVMQSAMQAHYGVHPSAGAAPSEGVGAAPPESPSLTDQLRRAGAMGLRNTAHGVMSIAGIINDPIVYGLNKAEDAVGIDPKYHFGTAAQATDRALNAAGVPDYQPQNGTERVVGRIEQGMGGLLSGMGVGSALSGVAQPTTSAVGSLMASNPAMQLASTVSGTTAGGLTQEAGGGPVAQFAASLLGGALPAAPQATGSLLRLLARGGESNAQRVRQNITDFGVAGTSPTIGQASQTKVARGLESLLAKTPGSAGVMRGAAENQAAQVSQGLDSIAGKLAPASDPAKAGRVITRGISGDGGFADRFKQTSSALYDSLDAHIAPDARVGVSHTMDALERLNQSIPGAPATSKLFQNARMQGIKSGLESDIGGTQAVVTRDGVAQKAADLRDALSSNDAAVLQRNAANKALMLGAHKPLGNAGIDQNVQAMLSQMVDGKLPYQALKKLRTLVGDEVSNFSLTSDVPRSKWKALYGALSQDMKDAAEQAGPQAMQAYSRANGYYNAGMSRLDAISHVVDKSGGPEAVFNAATSGTKDGATTLRAVMQSLKPDEQKVFASTMIRRLGKATPGQQNAAGDEFSMNTFLTNWNRLSPQAKSTIFDRFGTGFRSDMEAVARLAANVRQGSKVFANPSGSASTGAQIGTVGAFIMSVLSGHPATSAAIAGGAGLTNALARLMTSPAAVRFIAHRSRVPIQGLVPVLATLHTAAERSNDEGLKQLDTVLKQAVNQHKGPQH